MKNVCIKKCQYLGKIWAVSEILDSAEGVTPPQHCFKSLDEKIEEIKIEKAEAMSEIEQVKAELTDLGVVFDKRWGLSKLKGELVNTKKMRGK